MSKLELFYPQKPYVVTQKHGVPNPAYLQFGFSQHNGEDCLLSGNGNLHAITNLVVLDTGFYPTGAGNFITARTTEKVDLDALETSYVTFQFMHLKSIDVVKGQILQPGDYMGVCDNTGFSTGPHLHITALRTNAIGQKLDSNNSNGSFNHAPYFNGLYAIDIKVGYIKKALELLTQLLKYAKR